jgi:hypothetical protein
MGVLPSTARGGARTTSDVDELWRAYPLEQTPTTSAPAEGRSTDLGEAAGGGSSAEDARAPAASGLARTAALLVGAGALLLLGMLILASSRRGRRAAAPTELPVPSESAPALAGTPLLDASRPRFERDAGGVERARKGSAATRRGPVCQIRWSGRGRRSWFEAIVVDEEGSEHRVARSPRVERPGSSPPGETPEAKAALRKLSKELRDDGWKPLRAKGKDYGEQRWYTRRFRRPVEVEDDQAVDPTPTEDPREPRRNVGSW